MSTLLKLLPLELSELSLDDCVDPRQPVGRGEKVLGTLNDDEKRMYTLRVRTVSSAKHLQADLDLSTGVEHERIKSEIRRLASRAEVLDKLFWDMVNNSHNTWNTSVGVRAGFTVVEISPEMLGFGGILGRLFFPGELRDEEED